jgi:hypothetical protein
VQCTICGMENPPGHHYCNRCGGTLVVTGSQPSGPEAGRAARRQQRVAGRYWFGNLILLILAAAAAYMAYLRVLQPDRFDQIADETRARGRQSVQWVLEHPPSRWIDTVFKSETVWPEPSPEAPTDQSSVTTPQTAAATPQSDDTESSPTEAPESTAGTAQEPTQAEPADADAATETESATEAEAGATATPAPAYVAVSGEALVNLRSGPDTAHDIVGKAQPDTRYVATGVLLDGTWCRIEFQDQEAWIACYLDTVELFNGEGLPTISQW